MQYQFGSGNLFGLILSGGVLVPRKFAALQDVSLDFSFNLKELYGQSQFPLTIARGQGKIAGKAKAANINGAMLNDIFFGQTNATGKTESIVGEVSVPIPTTPFQITVANGATFKDDHGVTFLATGVPLTRVPSAPATGQYSVNSVTGVYTFAAADVGKVVLFDYTYTVAGSGNTTTINNLLSGTTPNFIASLPIRKTQDDGTVKTLYIRLNNCYSEKLTIATKIEDFLVPEFDFKAAADVSGVIGTISSAE
jgi:hypothetical protein